VKWLLVAACLVAGCANAAIGERVVPIFISSNPQTGARGLPMALQLGHLHGISGAEWSPDDEYVVTFSGSRDDNTEAKIWRVDDGVLVADLNRPSLRHVAWAPQGGLLAVATEEGAYVWRRASGQYLPRVGALRRVDELAWAPRGSTLAVAGEGLVALYEGSSLEFAGQLRLPWGSATPLRWSPDGSSLATSSFVLRRREARQLEFRALGDPARSHESELAWHPAGRLLATASDMSVRVYDTDTGALLCEHGFSSKVRAIAWSPTGLLAAAVDQRVYIGLNASTAAGGQPIVVEHPALVSAMAFRPNSSELLVGSVDGTLRWWTKTGSLAGEAPESCRGVHQIAWSKAGHLAASVGPDASARIWEFGRGLQLLRVLEGGLLPPNVVAWSPDDKFVAFGGRDAPARLMEFPTGRVLRSTWGRKSVNTSQVAMWQVPAFQELLLKPVPTSSVETLRWSRSGLLAIHTRNVDDELTVVDPNGVARRQFDVPGELTDLAWSPDAKSLAAGVVTESVGDFGLCVWHASDGEITRCFLKRSNREDDSAPTTIAWHPDGRRLRISGPHLPPSELYIEGGQLVPLGFAGNAPRWAPNGDFVAYGASSQPRGDELVVTAVSTSQRVRIKTNRQISDYSWSNDSRYLAVVMDDHLALLDPFREAVASVFGSGGPKIQGVAWSKQGTFLAAACDDGSVKFWNASLPVASPVTFLAVGDQTDWLAVSADGRFDGSPQGWNLLGWHDRADDYLRVTSAEVYFRDFFQPGLLQDFFEGKQPVSVPRLVARDRRQPAVSLSLDDALAPGSAVTPGSVRLAIAVKPATGDGQPNSGGARDLRLFRNGILVRAWRGDLLEGRSEARLSAEVSTANGENVFSAYAFNNDDVRSREATLRVSGGAGPLSGGRRFIVAVGIDEYENPKLNLTFAVADAHALAKEVALRGQRVAPASTIQVAELFNGAATREAFRSTLRGLSLGGARALGPEDSLLIFFSGHGVVEGGAFHLLFHDLSYRSPLPPPDRKRFHELAEQGLSDRELGDLLEGIDAKHILMVIDACQSGQLLESADPRPGPMNVKGLAQLAYDKGMYILAAAQADQAALEASRLGHGLVSSALLRGLVDLSADRSPKDGRLDAREWLDYAAELVPELLSFTAGRAKGLSLSPKTGPQHPRVYYRPHLEADPLVIAQ